jgi:peptidoglycan/xylan/chitin deacetylase (PgdA/CDA1 family)
MAHPYYEIHTSPARFAEQMRFLRGHGYRCVSLAEACDSSSGNKDTRKPVALTFDDGFRDFYTDAFPVLRQLGFAATVFVVTGWIHDRPARQEGREYMAWSDLRELHSYGIQIGSHTVTHPQLWLLDTDEIDYQVGYSKETIEDKLGTSVRSFSYPNAFPEHDRRFTHYLRDLLVNHGYENGVSTIIGRAGIPGNPFFLPRLPVNSWDDLALFRAKLEGGYDWLHFVQYTSKLFKSALTS